MPPLPRGRHRLRRTLPRWLVPGGSLAVVLVASGAVVLLPPDTVPADAAASLTLPTTEPLAVPRQVPLTPSVSGRVSATDVTPSTDERQTKTTRKPSAAPRSTAPRASASSAPPSTPRSTTSAAPRRSSSPQAGPTSTARSAPPVAGNLQARIWAQAQAHIGKGGPYRYGGKSLTGGSDCSYLVYRILLAAGIDVPYRSSGALRAVYRVVPRSQAVAGDLVWRRGHIGVYDGEGGLIDHGSGVGAKHQSLWYSPVFLRVSS